jgi:hypothetical protein
VNGDVSALCWRYFAAIKKIGINPCMVRGMGLRKSEALCAVCYTVPI